MIGNQARIAVLAMVAALLGGTVGSTLVSIPSSASLGQASPTELPPPRTGISPINFTFYGNSVRGWGFSNATITEPGPNITVYFGDVLNLTLIGNDSAPHSWFIDYDNSLAVSGDEPTSGDFNVAGNIVGRASLPAFHPGNWTYRCGMHPTTMTGTIRIHEQPRPVNLTLIGDAALGWGFSNATLREPGPALVVLWGTKLTLTLIAHDSAPHNWFIDYNNDVIVSPGEPASPDFNSPVGTIVVWPFIADQTGNWTYRCHIHPTSMTGSVSIVGGPPPQLPRGALPLITGIIIGALSVVLVFAVIYHVRAVRAAKRMR